MSFSIQIKESAAKELRRVAGPDRARIVAAIDRLAETPHLGAALKGDLRGLRRSGWETTGWCTKSGTTSWSFWSSASPIAGTPTGGHRDDSPRGCAPGMDCDRPPATFSLVVIRGHTLPLRGHRRAQADTGDT